MISVNSTCGICGKFVTYSEAQEVKPKHSKQINYYHAQCIIKKYNLPYLEHRKQSGIISKIYPESDNIKKPEESVSIDNYIDNLKTILNHI